MIFKKKTIFASIGALKFEAYSKFCYLIFLSSDCWSIFCCCKVVWFSGWVICWYPWSACSLTLVDSRLTDWFILLFDEIDDNELKLLPVWLLISLFITRSMSMPLSFSFILWPLPLLSLSRPSLSSLSSLSWSSSKGGKI